MKLDTFKIIIKIFKGNLFRFGIVEKVTIRHHKKFTRIDLFIVCK